MITTRYAVRHFEDAEMTREIGHPRFTASWSGAWDEMHCMVRPHRGGRAVHQPIDGVRLSIIERYEGEREAKCVQRFAH